MESNLVDPVPWIPAVGIPTQSLRQQATSGSSSYIPDEAIIKKKNIVLMHPQYMQQHGLCLGSCLVIQRNPPSAESGKFVVCECWPNTGLRKEYIGLNESCVQELGLFLDDANSIKSVKSHSESSGSSSATKKTPDKLAKRTTKSGQNSSTNTPQSTPSRTDASKESIALKYNIFFAKVQNKFCPSEVTFLMQSEREISPERLQALSYELVSMTIILGTPVTFSSRGELCTLRVSSVKMSGKSPPLSIELDQQARRLGTLTLANDSNLIPLVYEIDLRTSLFFKRKSAKDPPLDSNPSWYAKTEQEVFAALRKQGLAGMRDVVRQLLQLVQFALDPGLPGSENHQLQSTAQELRPRGAILHGVAGTGKTLLACSLAESLGLLSLVFHPVDIFAETKALQKVFLLAQSKAPCILVLDEIDGLAPQPSSSSNQSHGNVPMLLKLVDLLPRGVFVLGTTNRPQGVHSALTRPGRLDRMIQVDVPSESERKDILAALADSALQTGVLSMEEIEQAAEVTHGFVGADLTALWREAVLLGIQESSGQAHGCRPDLVHAVKLVKPSALREVEVRIPHCSWSEIGGQLEAKQALQEAIRLTVQGRDDAFRGILLFGPPGCSKTLLAKAVASECKANFITVKGAELLSKWVGESEKAVRDTFRRAAGSAPCVIFFDEIDALAVSRSEESSSMAEHRVLAQLLTELDGMSYQKRKGVIVLAATNRPDLMDSALLRPGRMDRMIYISLPKLDERINILKVHTRNVPVDDQVCHHMNQLGARTDGMSGAEIAALVREAALCALEEDPHHAAQVCLRHFESALQRIRPRTRPELLDLYKNYIANAKGVYIMNRSTLLT